MTSNRSEKQTSAAALFAQLTAFVDIEEEEVEEEEEKAEEEIFAKVGCAMLLRGKAGVDADSSCLSMRAEQSRRICCMRITKTLLIELNSCISSCAVRWLLGMLFISSMCTWCVGATVTGSGGDEARV
mmetsp:Transcript_22089/g.32433  ORF Transcript_22089/g.32433 Transcript_22089/m.32433 type:complete len:128 (-) Transcript_22089:306-689(-)